MADKMIQKYKIFHISDLHFGQNHARSNNFQLYTTPMGSNNLGAPISNLILDCLPPRKAERQNIIIICSGDLATFNQRNEFKEAVRFLKKFTKEYDIPREQILISPGNHDIYWQDYSLADKFSMMKLFEKNFKDFPNALRKDGPCYYFPRHRLLVYCFNSCLLCGAREQIPELDALIKKLPKNKRRLNKKLLENLTRIDPGFIGQPQREKIKRNIKKKLPKVEAYKQEKLLRIAVLHHHVNLICPEFKRFASVVDAAPLKKALSENDFHFILHGHKHFPYYCKDSTFMDCSSATLPVLASGTMGGKPNVGAYYEFNILDVQNYKSKATKVVVNRKNFDSYGQAPAMDPDKTKFVIDMGKRKKDKIEDKIEKDERAVNSLRKVLSGSLPSDFAKKMFNMQKDYMGKNPIRVEFYDIGYKIQLKSGTSGDHKVQHVLKFRNCEDTDLDNILLSFAGSRNVPFNDLENFYTRYRLGKGNWLKFVEQKVIKDDYIKIVKFYFRKNIPYKKTVTIKIIYSWPDTVEFTENEWGIENWIFKYGLKKFSLSCKLTGKAKIESASAYSAYFDSDKWCYESKKVETLPAGNKVKWDYAPSRNQSIYFIRCLIKKIAR